MTKKLVSEFTKKSLTYVAVFGAAAGGRLQRRNDAGRGLAVVSVGDL